MPCALHKKNNNNNKIINVIITRMFYARGIDSAFHTYELIIRLMYIEEKQKHFEKSSPWQVCEAFPSAWHVSLYK